VEVNIRRPLFRVFKRFIFINFIEFGFNVFLRRTYLYSRFITLFLIIRVIYTKLLRYIIIYVISAFIIIIKFKTFIFLYYIFKPKAVEILNNYIYFFKIFIIVFFIRLYKFIIYKTICYRFVYNFNN